MRWENIWKFETAQFRVTFDVTSDDNLDLSWDDDGSVREGLETGEFVAFGCRVAVWHGGEIVGQDSLWGCVYRSVDEFITSHRDADPMNRNCSLMCAARGRHVVICHYFPGMVQVAVANARDAMRKPRPPMRATA